MRIGVIDVGTNSVKLDIARVRGSTIDQELHRSEVTRLGAGLSRRRTLRPDAMRRTIRAILRWTGMCRRRDCDRILAVGTQALRVASNARKFLVRCRRETGVAVRIISGRREAELSFRGAMPGGSRIAAVVIDVGGGSVELTAGRGGKVAAAVSLPIGALSLTERWVKSDPPSGAELERVRLEIRRRLDHLPPAMKARLRGVAGPIAVGGTAVTLGRICRIPDRRLQGAALSRRVLSRWVARLARMSSAERQRRYGLDPGRADIIVAGGLILLEAMEGLGWGALRLSLRGLRTGLMMESAR